MKKLSKISLEENLRKLDQLSNTQLDQVNGGTETPNSVHFDPPPYTTTPPVSITFNPFDGSGGITGHIYF